MNLLINPSFEKGWWHKYGAPELQLANGFDAGFLDGQSPTDVPWASQPARRPEFRVLPKSQVPQNEWPLFFLDGDYCVKAFGASKPIYFWMFQDVGGLTEGATYRLTVPVHLDIYKWDGHKVYPALGEGAANVRLYARHSDTSVSVSDWMSPEGARLPDATYELEYGKYCYLSFEFVARGTVARVGIKCAAKWADKSNNFFFDLWLLEQIGAEPPPGPGRPPYDRTYVLLPQDATEEEARIQLAIHHSKKRTIGYSADDAGADNDLVKSRTVIVPYNRFPGDIRKFFETYYPGVNLILDDDVPPGPDPDPDPEPPPPPPPTKTTRGYIGPHIQAMVAGTLEYIARVRPPVAKIFGAGDVFSIKAASPDTHVVFRKYLHGSEQQKLLNMTDKNAAAQLYINSFLDVFNDVVPKLHELYPDQDPVLYVESLNEIYACNQTAYNANSALFDIAFMEQVHAMGLPVRCVVFCAPQGNPEISGGDLDIVLMLGRKCQQYSGLMGYHDYWGANIVYPANHLVDAAWPWSPGRWQLFDDFLTSKGVYVTWFGGESGACTSDNGYNLSSGGGWRADECHDGSISRYVAEIMHVDELDAAWDAQNGGRRIGRVLFTDGLTGAWDLFECGKSLWGAVGDAMVNRYGA